MPTLLCRQDEHALSDHIRRRQDRVSRLQATSRSQGTPASQATAGKQGDLIIFDLRALAHDQDDGPGVTVLSESREARTVLFTFKAGQQLKEHQTSSQILVQVLRGQIVFAAAGSSVPARSGMLLQLEANVRHSIVAQTNAVVLVTMTPSPAQHSLEREVFDHLTPLVARQTHT
jgi:quercetin dioxygenase-like cupin family protein